MQTDTSDGTELAGTQLQAHGRWPAPLAFLAVLGIVVLATVLGFAATATLLRLAPAPAGAPSMPPWIVLCGLLVTQAVMIGGAMLAAGRRGALPRVMLAIGSPKGGVADYVVAIAVTTAVLAVYNLVVVLGLGHDFWADLRPFANLVRHEAWALALLAIGLGAPLSEELLFRGFLQTALTPTRLDFWGAAVIATLFWAALHFGYSAVGMVEVVLIGFLFSWTVRRSGSIRPALLVHALYNSGLTLLLRYGPVPF